VLPKVDAVGGAVPSAMTIKTVADGQTLERLDRDLAAKR